MTPILKRVKVSEIFKPTYPSPQNAVDMLSLQRGLVLGIKTLKYSYLNNSMFLSRDYRLIVAPRKFDVLKTNIFREAKLRGQMCILSLLFTTKFSSALQFQNQIELFSTFLDESRESQM